MAVKRVSSIKNKRRITLNRQTNVNEPAKNKRLAPKVAKEKQKSGAWVKKVSSSLSVVFLTLFWLVLLSGVSMSLLFGHRYLTTSQYFSLKYIEIQGNVRLLSREILESVQLEEGGNLLVLSLKEIEQKVARHPWVEEVSVKRILPDRLVVGVKERTPAFMRLLQNEMYYSDIQGNIIGPVGVTNFVPLPTLDVEKGAEEFAEYLTDYLGLLQKSGLLKTERSIGFIRLSVAREIEFIFTDTDLRVSLGLEDWGRNFTMLAQVVVDLQHRNELENIRFIKAHGVNVWVENTKIGRKAS